LWLDLSSSTMNRLSSLRTTCVESKKISNVHLGNFGKKKVLSSTPVTTSFGRGYGIQNSRPLMYLSSTTLDIPSNKATPQFFRGMASKPKEAEVAQKEESFDTIRSSIASLCDKEIQSIADFERDSIHVNIGEKFLKDSGFKITEERRSDEMDEGNFAVLTKEMNNTSIKVSFRLEEEEQDEDDYQNEEEGDEEEEEEEERENVIPLNEHPEFESLPRKHSLRIELTIHGKGKEKEKEGTFHLEGFSGIDNRLYINEILVEKTGDKEASHCVFDDLSDEIQDRIYDYLDSLEVDDKLALFVKQIVARKRSESDINFLKKFKQLISV